MLEIADKSVVINEDGNGQVANQDPAPKPLTLMANSNDETPLITIEKMGNMIITVEKRKFECVPVESVSEVME